MLLFTLEVLHAKRKCFEDCFFFFNVKIITTIMLLTSRLTENNKF